MTPTLDYQEFLERKRVSAPAVGFEVDAGALNGALFDWQQAVEKWLCRRGWSALFADCGMGKSLLQLDFCRHVFERTRKPVLILAPLGVTMQLRVEGEKFGIPVQVCRTGKEKLAEINVTNYDRLHLFSPDDFSGLDLDESSVLKGFNGKFRREVTAFAHRVDYRLAATATPSPNDLVELTTHAEFLGVMSAKEVTGEFFRTEGEVSNRWKLKPHAKDAFYTWLASWAVALRRPSDLGYSDAGFVLPPLSYHQHTVEAPIPQQALFQAEARGIQEQRRVRRETLDSRVAVAAELANSDREPWLCWCDLNDESAALKASIPDAIEVRGSDSIEHKERALLGFADGTYRVMVTKPSIAGHGLNYQHCAAASFVGLSNSYEQVYQATRRNWRFGQQREVHIHIICSEADGEVVRNQKRKEQQLSEMLDELVKRMGDLSAVSARRETLTYEPREQMIVPAWLTPRGDSLCSASAR